MESGMNRRRFLKLAAGSSPIIAGCSSQPGQQSETVASTYSPTDRHTSTSTLTSSPSDTPTETEEPTPTPRKNPDTIFVGPDGSDVNEGTVDNPLLFIQTALEKAQPGDTVYLLSGEYREDIETVRAGTADNPITLTGPPDAVYRGRGPFINHSHIHITGMTINGLIDAENPDDPESYQETLIKVNEAFRDSLEQRESTPQTVSESNYLSDIVIKPHGLGNCRADFIKVNYSKNIEIGEFSVIGPAGAKFVKGDVIGHNSEFIYLGNPPSSPVPPDLTRNVHIHHIDNTGGYPHSELIDCKTGTRDVAVEYCTDADGAMEAVTDNKKESFQGSSVRIGGTNVTVRWNRLSGSRENGIEITSYAGARDDPIDAYADGGTDNAIYGNHLLDYEGYAIAMPYRDEGQSQPEQRVICGNMYNGNSLGDPGQACPEDVPEGDGIGHLGGDSPWE